MFQTAPTGRTPLCSDPNNYPQPVLRDHSNKTAMKRCKTAPPDEYGNSSAARSALINNPRYNPSRNGVQTKKNDPSELNCSPLVGLRNQLPTTSGEHFL